MDDIDYKAYKAWLDNLKNFDYEEEETCTNYDRQQYDKGFEAGRKEAAGNILKDLLKCEFPQIVKDAWKEYFKNLYNIDIE